MTAEWHNVTERFHGFIGSLHLSPLEKQRAQAAASEIVSSLRLRFRPTDHPAPSLLERNQPYARENDSSLIGGHAKGTALSPARLIDMVFVLPRGLRPTIGNRPEMELILDEMAVALNGKFAARESPSGDWLLVRSFDDVAIRLIPAFRTVGENLIVGLPQRKQMWLAMNPAAEDARLRAADLASGGKATHLIMMLKAWRRFRKVPISPFALELMVCEFVLAWTYLRRSLLFYDWMIRDFFFWAVHQVGREILTPVALECVSLGDLWLEEAERAHILAQNACVMERENRDAEAIARWCDVFGPRFSNPAQTLMPPDSPTDISSHAPSDFLPGIGDRV
ncbi:MAG: hypothetical protein HN403_09635 [Rhodospirillales bacterium]|jgi:hypothetical protein|nr:hypothetical protein [Rhodospirillales bacterium]